jgi:predicted protein tyrosine phosphatase
VRWLTVCDGGNVRSVALAFVLKWERGQEAIAIGRIHVSEETMNMMCEWADRIVIMEPHMDESIPLEFRDKLLCCDVGPDRYGIHIHNELLEQVRVGADWLLERDHAAAS